MRDGRELEGASNPHELLSRAERARVRTAASIERARLNRLNAEDASRASMSAAERAEAIDRVDLTDKTEPSDA